MALLLDAYMQCFHIGLYRLAGHFFSVGWVGESHRQGLRKMKITQSLQQPQSGSFQVSSNLSAAGLLKL